MEFLFALLKAALGPYIEQTYGPWNEAEQRSRFFQTTRPRDHKIVKLGDRPIGCLNVEWLPGEVKLNRVFLLPGFQRQGIGSRLVLQLLSEAKSAGLPVRLRVFKVNPARRLWLRLGFVVTGETETHVLMENVAQRLRGERVAGGDVEYSVRPARLEDAESIVELLNPIIEEGTYTIMDERLSAGDQIEFMRAFPERGVYHVAVHNDDQCVLGLQDVQPVSVTARALEHVGEISTFVALSSLRKGIGRSLSQATFRAAKERGFTKLMASIRADNPVGIAFYLSQGFNVIGTARKHAFLRDKYIDEVFMERPIC